MTTLLTIGKLLLFLAMCVAGAWIRRRIAMPLGMRPTRRPRRR